MRNSSMSGGYSQQGYQSRPQTNWAQPGPPMQQPGYGYVQPGAYPGQTPQYSQPPYSGYPPQPTSAGYAAGWDQSTAPQNPQASQGGYDYYNQQPPSQPQQAQGGTVAPADASGYAYGQQAGYSQGQTYSQDGYGGYGQPQPNTTNGGYDQQQLGYNSTYPGAPTPAADGSYGTQSDPNQAPASGQAYNAGGQPSPNPNPSYPQATATQPGYGVAPSSHSGYGTQPVAGYGSYGAPTAPKAPSGQPAYAQPEQSPSSAQGSGYPTSQPAYGVSPYGAPPGTQPTYAQQQPHPYGNAYASYSQPPPAYSSDGAAGGSTHGTYEATPQTAQPTSGTTTKASPPS